MESIRGEKATTMNGLSIFFLYATSLVGTFVVLTVIFVGIKDALLNWIKRSLQAYFCRDHDYRFLLERIQTLESKAYELENKISSKSTH